MEDQIEEIIKNTTKQGEKIAINNLRHKPRNQAKVVDEQTITKLKSLKKYILNDSSIPTERLNNYYCSLCGRINLVTNVLLEHMPKRKTDGAIAIDLRSNFIKLNLQKDKIRHILRDKGLETYYRWKCQCGMPIGYSVLTYEELQDVRIGDTQINSNARPFFYVFSDGLVEKMKESKLLNYPFAFKKKNKKMIYANVHLLRSTQKQNSDCLVTKMIASKSKDKPLTIEQKFTVSRIIASYYMKGSQFGYKRGKYYVEQQLNYMISSSAYNNCLTNIVYMGFKELQDFLKKNTNKNIKIINHQQWGIIRTPLIRCREWMKQVHVDTFFKLISSHYQLKTVSITKSQALSLYDELYSLVVNHQQKQKIMQQRRISKQQTMRQQKFEQIQKNEQQYKKVRSKDEQKEQSDLQFQIKSQYFFQTVNKQKTKKDAEIDYDKFQGDLGLNKKQEKKETKNS